MSIITSVPALAALPPGTVIRNTPPRGYPSPGALMFVGESQSYRRYYSLDGQAHDAQEVLAWAPITVEWTPPNLGTQVEVSRDLKENND